MRQCTRIADANNPASQQQRCGGVHWATQKAGGPPCDHASPRQGPQADVQATYLFQGMIQKRYIIINY